MPQNGAEHTEPVDPDVAPSRWPGDGSPRRELIATLTAISAGGALGAAARYGAGLLWPTAATDFPWTTFAVNVVGCALMGALMVLVTERFDAPPLVRPFLGTGVLGGFTTFSTATLDTQRLLGPGAAAAAGSAATGLVYVAATLVAAALALWLATWATRALVGTGR